MNTLIITTANPDLGWVLNKNPNTIKESGPYKRAMRKGHVYGWFKDDKFVLTFRDSPTETSFGKEFEYLDQTRYSSPLVVMGMINESLHNTLALQTVQYEKPEFPTTVSCVLDIPPNLAARIKNSKLASQIEPIPLRLSERVDSKVYNVSCTAPTVGEALNAAYLVATLAALALPGDLLRLDHAPVAKIMKTLARCNAPYSLWAFFSSRAITSYQLYNKVKDMFPSNMVIQYGNTQTQRYNAVTNVLKAASPAEVLVDIGCGEEMYYTCKLAGAYQKVIAIDSNPELMDDHEHILRKKQLAEKVICVYGNLATDQMGLPLSRAHVLLVEVLEHSTPEEGLALLNEVLSEAPDTVVVTMPNRSFNQYYGMEEGQFRHPDHKWEPTPKEFADLILTACQTERGLLYGATVTGVGDCVDGIFSTHMAVFTWTS